MVNKENIDNFLNYNYRPLRKKEVAELIFLNLFLSIWPCVLGGNRVQWLVVMILINLLLIAAMIVICSRLSQEKIARYSFDCTMSLILSAEFALMGYRLLTSQKAENFMLLFLIGLWLLCCNIIIVLLTIRNIKRNKFATQQKDNNVPLLSSIGAIVGIAVARTFFKSMDENIVVSIAAGAVLFVATIFCFGCISLLKVVLLMRDRSGDGTDQGTERNH